MGVQIARQDSGRRKCQIDRLHAAGKSVRDFPSRQNQALRSSVHLHGSSCGMMEPPPCDGVVREDRQAKARSWFPWKRRHSELVSRHSAAPHERIYQQAKAQSWCPWQWRHTELVSRHSGAPPERDHPKGDFLWCPPDEAAAGAAAVGLDPREPAVTGALRLQANLVLPANFAAADGDEAGVGGDGLDDLLLPRLACDSAHCRPCQHHFSPLRTSCLTFFLVPMKSMHEVALTVSLLGNSLFGVFVGKYQ